MSEDKGKPKRKGPPPEFMNFWREVYDNGKKRVPNPNPKTKNRKRDVAASTAMKDPRFKEQVKKEFKKWKKSQKKEKGSSKEGIKDYKESLSKLENVVGDWPEGMKLSEPNWEFAFGKLNKLIGDNSKLLDNLSPDKKNSLLDRVQKVHNQLSKSPGYEKAKRKYQKQASLNLVLKKARTDLLLRRRILERL